MVRAAALFIPGLEGAQARDGARGHGPTPVGKQHGLYVVDVGDGEHRAVSTPMGPHSIGPRPLGGGEGPSVCRVVGLSCCRGCRVVGKLSGSCRVFTSGCRAGALAAAEVPLDDHSGTAPLVPRVTNTSPERRDAGKATWTWRPPPFAGGAPAARHSQHPQRKDTSADRRRFIHPVRHRPFPPFFAKGTV